MSSSLPAEEAAPTSRRTLSLHLDISGDLSADDRQAELAQRLAATALGGGHQLTVVRETGDSSTADVASSSSPTAAAHSAAVDASFDSASAAAAPVIATKTIDLLSTRVVKEGGLCKLGAKVKSWKNRYFKLVGFVLSYYESAESQQTVLGEINLIGTLVKPEPKEMFGLEHTFSITQTQAGQRTYYIVAPSAEDLAEWIFLLKQRHSFAPQGLPLRLNPRVHINMNLNPDDDALRAIAVNSQPINSSYISTDADRKENSKSTLKGAVSKKKRRFVMDGFDLDLTYITNRIMYERGDDDSSSEEEEREGSREVTSSADWRLTIFLCVLVSPPLQRDGFPRRRHGGDVPQRHGRCAALLRHASRGPLQGVQPLLGAQVRSHQVPPPRARVPVRRP